VDLNETLALIAAPIYAAMIGSGPSNKPEMERMMRRALREAHALWLLTLEKPWKDD
jgi:hypothetical protein